MTKATFKGGAWFVGEISLTQSEAAILVPLLFKKSILIETFITALWPHPDKEPEWPEKQIAVYACTLNRKLERYGCEYKVRGNGRREYTLEKLPVQAGGA